MFILNTYYKYIEGVLLFAVNHWRTTFVYMKAEEAEGEEKGGWQDRRRKRKKGGTGED